MTQPPARPTPDGCTPAHHGGAPNAEGGESMRLRTIVTAAMTLAVLLLGSGIAEAVVSLKPWMKPWM
jgi:hypothetical protein